MKRLINIRGGCASGKTTAVKGFCKRHETAAAVIQTRDYKCPITVIDGGRYIALGNYLLDGCTGVDRYKDGKTQIKAAIYGIIANYNPEVIIFEGMLISLLYNATKEIADYAGNFGYEYVGVWLHRSFQSQIDMLLKRNNGTPKGVKHIAGDRKRVLGSARRLAANGYKVVPIDVEKIAESEMWSVIESQCH